jgi:PBSX family phage terminase large subunit
MPVDLDAVTRTLAPIHLASIAESTARINIWHGAVRSGKTVASLLRLLIAIAQAPTSGRILIFGRTRETITRNVFAVLTDPALFGPLAPLTTYNPGAATATILGRQVDVIGANDAKAEPKARGMTLCLAYGDELTTLPQAFFVQVLARLSVPGAQLFGTTNPDGPAHWLRRDFLLRADALDLRSWRSTLDDNPHLDPAYVTSLKAEYVGLWHRRFVLGEWCLAEGAVFDMFDPDRHVAAELPLITRWVACGVDYGTTNPFHAIILGLGTDARLYITREWRHDSRQARRSLTDPEYSQALRTFLQGVPVPGTDLRGVSPEWTVIDPSAASFRVQLYRDGVTARLADNTVLDGIRTLTALLATGLLKVHSSCRDLLSEIPGYSWDDDKAAKGEDEPVKTADHGIDAARYAVHTTRTLWRHQLRTTLEIAV